MNKVTESFYSYISPVLVNTANVAAFDLDYTLIRAAKGVFPKLKNKYKLVNEYYDGALIDYDIVFLPGRIEKLIDLQNQGYMITIITNQKVTRYLPLNSKLSRLNIVIKILEKYNINIIAMMATGTDKYRKPSIGMWRNIFGNQKLKVGFYCGDAAGRISDFSDSDAQFARNLQIPFYLPEQIFSYYIPTDKDTLYILFGSISTMNLRKSYIEKYRNLLISENTYVISGEFTNPQEQIGNKYIGSNIIYIYFSAIDSRFSKLKAVKDFFKNLIFPSSYQEISNTHI